MKKYFFAGIISILPSMENSWLPTDETPRLVRFAFTNELEAEGRKIAASPVSGELVGYQGKMLFLKNEKDSTETIRFDSPFSTPVSWSNDGRFLLGGLHYYDTKLRQKDTRDWVVPVISMLPEKNKSIETYWSIYNAQWDRAMRFLIVFSGYEGPRKDLSPKLRSDFLHQLVMIDSSGKKTQLLAGFSDRDEITDIALEGNLLVTTGKNICWWNLQHPKERNYLAKSPGRGAQVFLQHKGTLAAVTDASGQLMVWNPGHPDSVVTIEAHKGEIYDAVFHPELPLLFTTGADKELKCWWWNKNKLVQVPHDLPTSSNYALAGFDNQQRLILMVYTGKEKKKCCYGLGLAN